MGLAAFLVLLNYYSAPLVTLCAAVERNDQQILAVCSLRGSAPYGATLGVAERSGS